MEVIYLCLLKKNLRRLLRKSSKVNELVLHLTRLCQKFDFSWTSYISRLKKTLKINILLYLDDFHVSCLRLVLQLKNKPKKIFLSRRLTRKSSIIRLTRKSSMILFWDSGQTFIIFDDFYVSRRTDKFCVSRLEKN